MLQTVSILPLSTEGGIGGVTVSIAAFQAVDPGSTPGSRIFLFFFPLVLCVLYSFFFPWQSYDALFNYIQKF